MLHEFIFVAQTVFVQNLVISHGNGVVHTCAKRQVAISEFFKLMHESESPGTTYFFDEGGGGEVDSCAGGVLLINGMVIE